MLAQLRDIVNLQKSTSSLEVGHFLLKSEIFFIENCGTVTDL